MKFYGTKGVKALTVRVGGWGKLKQLYVPSLIFDGGTLNISAHALAVFMVLLHVHKSKPKRVRESELMAGLDASVRIGQSKLIERTGYSRNMLTKALKELNERRFIETVDHRKKYGEFGIHEHFLRDPETGERLRSKEDYRSVIAANNLRYFSLPTCVITEANTRWSLAKLTASELKMYASITYLAALKRQKEFEASPRELRRVSGIEKNTTLESAIRRLELDRGLVLFSEGTVSLCNPYTGVPLEEREGRDEDNPMNYYEVRPSGGARQFNFNTGDASAIEELVRSALPPEQVAEQKENGDLKILCPFHLESVGSCFVRVHMNGCFKCFGCGTSGSLTKLLAQLRSVAKRTVIEEVAKSLGKTPEYHPPEGRVIDRYRYNDQHGNLVKEVLRYANNPDGSKNIRQRRPVKNGEWLWDVNGVPPMLFNLDLIELVSSRTLVVTEGEKDATTVTNLHLRTGNTGGGWVIGTTSGGSGSWHPSLAPHFRGSRVLLMPDADAAGERFAKAVKASLDVEGIEYRVVTFADVGAKDVSEFLDRHTVEELVRRIGLDWSGMPDGAELIEYGAYSPLNYQLSLPLESDDWLLPGGIVI